MHPGSHQAIVATHLDGLTAVRSGRPSCCGPDGPLHRRRRYRGGGGGAREADLAAGPELRRLRARPESDGGAGRRRRGIAMHHSDIDRFAALAATMGVWMCGLTRVHNLVWALAVQTGVLGVIAVLVG